LKSNGFITKYDGEQTIDSISKNRPLMLSMCYVQFSINKTLLYQTSICLLLTVTSLCSVL